jgi:hypothetical protein
VLRITVLILSGVLGLGACANGIRPGDKVHSSATAIDLAKKSCAPLATDFDPKEGAWSAKLNGENWDVRLDFHGEPRSCPYLRASIAKRDGSVTQECVLCMR